MWKESKYGVFSGVYFPVFSPNTGKYGPKKTTYLDTFHAVKILENLGKKRLQHSSFTVNFWNFFRAAFLPNISRLENKSFLFECQFRVPIDTNEEDKKEE